VGTTGERAEKNFKKLLQAAGARGHQRKRRKAAQKAPHLELGQGLAQQGWGQQGRELKKILNVVAGRRCPWPPKEKKKSSTKINLLTRLRSNGRGWSNLLRYP
jgi:hypothetical protein